MIIADTQLQLSVKADAAAFGYASVSAPSRRRTRRMTASLAWLAA
ncbi:MAG: hypothetical protein VXW91_04825 [Pseudomonadota bacterium]|nr:hypothetical protein [Pseudomonadota bacterium]MEC8664448.1 hypothetical protein [Pseudomonadota bacterium]